MTYPPYGPQPYVQHQQNVEHKTFYLWSDGLVTHTMHRAPWGAATMPSSTSEAEMKIELEQKVNRSALLAALNLSEAQMKAWVHEAIKQAPITEREIRKVTDDDAPVEFTLESGSVTLFHSCCGARVVDVLPSAIWKVVRPDPLTLDGAIECDVCGLVGWIHRGRWFDKK